MTDGISSRKEYKKNAANERLINSRNAASELGFSWIKQESYPDNELDSIPLIRVVRSIEEVKRKINPKIIYTHSSADLNVDHRIVNQATLTAFRPKSNEEWIEIRAFEIPSSTDYGHKSITNTFYPNLYVDISKFFNMKINALKCYEEEMLPNPNSRSFNGIKNLAKYRGNQVGLEYAESFEILRKIDR
jgi:LmbE family N-acetylglucosaminyl deacetylase